AGARQERENILLSERSLHACRSAGRAQSWLPGGVQHSTRLLSCGTDAVRAATLPGGGSRLFPRCAFGQGLSAWGLAPAVPPPAPRSLVSFSYVGLHDSTCATT